MLSKSCKTLSGILHFPHALHRNAGDHIGLESLLLQLVEELQHRIVTDHIWLASLLPQLDEELQVSLPAPITAV